MSKSLPLDRISFAEIAQKYHTPVYIYQGEIIEKRIAELKDFKIVRFAQKACSNIGILALMRKNGVVVDAVSAGEVVRAQRAGYRPGPDSEDVVYTADIFDADAREIISQTHLPVNVGSPDMIAQLAEFSPESPLILRINPGFGHGHSQKVNTGGAFSKHGIWHEDISLCMEMAAQKKMRVQGIHMHIGSGSDFEHLSQVCVAMEKAASQVGPALKVISAGGGLPIPYKENGERIDVKKYFEQWEFTRRRIEQNTGAEITLEVEPGRYLSAEAGFLLTQICSVKNSGGNQFYLVDAGFNDLIRPAMYGAHHHISLLSPTGAVKNGGLQQAVVAGPLCESCDVFTQDENGFVEKRDLPSAEVGDFVVLHDAGAYGAAMSSNYNTKKLAAEVLVHQGKTALIRERQTFDNILQNEKIPDFI